MGADLSTGVVRVVGGVKRGSEQGLLRELLVSVLRMVDGGYIDWAIIPMEEASGYFNFD